MTLLSWFRGSVPPRYPIAKEAADDGGKRIAIPPRDLQKSVRYKGLGEGGGRGKEWKKSGKFYVFSKLDPESWRIFQRKFFEYNAAFQWIFLGSRVE